jgi:hypothetical protein
MKATFFVIAYGVYLLVGLVQITATASGIQHATGLWWVFSWMIAMFFGWIPLVGTALGIYGAHADWGWGWPAALGLFVAIPLLFFVPAIVIAAVEAMRRR